MGRERRASEDLAVEVPSFFRCPISLDLMKSPVSLCTGVTYDRSSIATWLESGHRTCPATMQTLPTTDLTPNHNLRRLIDLWSSSSSSSSSAAVLRRQDLPLEAMEMAVRSLHPLPHRGDIDAPVLSSLVTVLKEGSMESRIAAAGIIASAVASSAGIIDGVFATILPELLRLLEEADEEARVAGISCLAALSSIKEWTAEIFSGGGSVITAAGKLLGIRPAAEKAMTVIRTAASCTEGRILIMEEKETIIPLVVERMMELSLEGKEDAVMVLWVVCCVYGDERESEEVARRDGMTKMLLMVQSGCSPLVKKMASDLIKVIRTREKSLPRRCASRSAHISPF